MREEETADGFLGGAIVIVQPARGYRAGMDAMLLAAGLDAEAGARLLELGCGAGAALIAAAWRLPQATLAGAERDAAMAALARRNVATNGLEARVRIEEVDVFARAPLGVFEGVFCNPPFANPGEGAAPDASRTHAFITEHAVEDWVKAAVDRLTGGGVFTIIHRADKLAEILKALDGRLGGVEVLPIRPRESEPAKRVLVRARKGSRAALRLLKGLDLHEADGRFTPQADAIFRGEAAIVWAGG